MDVREDRPVNMGIGLAVMWKFMGHKAIGVLRAPLNPVVDDRNAPRIQKCIATRTKMAGQTHVLSVVYTH